ncbi:Peptidoglycan-N-acetylglucosamine deacetylase [Corynebacterium freiburgense]|nr:Peptidoglycan-N-acetylglucosamine deacetylase [Corynebacterium freiburgense]
MAYQHTVLGMNNCFYDVLESQKIVSFKIACIAILGVIAIIAWSVPSAEASTGPSSVGLQTDRPSKTSSIHHELNCSKDNCVALTFDDGPGPYTPKLLDILRGYGVKSTFYLLGSSIPGDERVIRRMVLEGHEVGNHSMHHYEMTTLSPAEVYAEWHDTSELIYGVTGSRPKTARPPYGAADEVTYAQMERLGMAGVLWSIDPRDWADRNSALVCERIATEAHPGAIILLHDVHSTSVDAVPCIIERLAAKGYKFTTVTELLGDPVPGRAYWYREMPEVKK